MRFKNILIILILIETIALIHYYFSYQKYSGLDKVLTSISQREYSNNYKCKEFSEDLVAELKSIGIQSEIVIGESPTTLNQENIEHAWVGIWFDPQSGLPTKNYERR